MVKDEPPVDLTNVDAVRMVEELYMRKVPLETIEGLYSALDDHVSGKYPEPHDE